MSERLPNRRIRLLLALFVLVFAGTLARAVWLQGVQASSLERMAVRQHRETVAVAAPRGAIVDRMGVDLAIGEQATTVYADPREVKDPRRVAAAAERILGVDGEALAAQLADRSSRFVYVARKADPAKAAELERLKLAGLAFYPEERRAYPQSTVAAQVLGYAGVDNEGLEGIERSLDGALAGRPGEQTVIRDPAGHVLDVLSSRPERPGADVRLTLDHQIQANAEQVLRRTVRAWHAKSATAVVLDPRTGGVLAMAIAPGYDANRFPLVPAERRRNRVLTDVYEPGSTFKLVTIAAALSEGVVNPRTTFTLPPSIRVADRVINEHEPRPTVRWNVSEILYKSSNVGTITIAELLGERRLASWIDRFGFGRPTGIDFPGESGGIVLPVDKWSGSTIGNVPIGQGIGVTAMQMAAAYSALANGGVLVQPHLVDRVGGRPFRKLERRRILAPWVAGEVMQMLRGVVYGDGGTGALAAVPGYTVAGKTGTAAKPEGGGYSDSKYVASFVGIVPASAPRLVVLVAVDEPQGAIWGGVVAAPAFRDIARFALQYLEVPPDRPADETR